MSAAVVIIKQNRLMRYFRDVGATTPATARTPEEVGFRNSWLFRRMVSRGVFLEAKPGHYYIDEYAADEFVRLRRARLLRWLVIVLVLCAAVYVVFTSGV